MICNNSFLRGLSVRGWLYLLLVGVNLYFAFLFASAGSWLGLLSLGVSFLMWVAISVDPKCHR